MSETEAVQEELDRLQQRHTRVLYDANEKENTWKQRLDAMNAAKEAYSTEHLETIQQLTRQNEIISSSFKVCK